MSPNPAGTLRFIICWGTRFEFQLDHAVELRPLVRYILYAHVIGNGGLVYHQHSLGARFRHEIVQDDIMVDIPLLVDDVADERVYLPVNERICLHRVRVAPVAIRAFSLVKYIPER